MAHIKKKATSKREGEITLLKKILWRERSILLKSCELGCAAPFQATACFMLLKSSLQVIRERPLVTALHSLATNRF